MSNTVPEKPPGMLPIGAVCKFQGDDIFLNPLRMVVLGHEYVRTNTEGWYYEFSWVNTTTGSVTSPFRFKWSTTLHKLERLGPLEELALQAE